MKLIDLFVYLLSFIAISLLSLHYITISVLIYFSSLDVKDLKIMKMLLPFPFPSRSMILLLAIFILLCIALIYQTNSAGVGYVIPTERIDCSPFPSIDSGKCAARGCIWDENYDKVMFCSIAEYYCRALNLGSIALYDEQWTFIWTINVLHYIYFFIILNFTFLHFFIFLNS